MIAQVGDKILFGFVFTATKTGKAGLAPTCTVVKITDAGVETAVAVDQACSASPNIDGLYYYIYEAASAGSYVGRAATADATVDLQHTFAMWLVGLAWIEHLDFDISVIYNMLRGAGATQRSITIQSDDPVAVPVGNAQVWVSVDSPSSQNGMRWVALTNDSGAACKLCDNTEDGWFDTGTTYYVWVSHPSYIFPMPTSWDPATGNLVIEGTAVSGGTRPTLDTLVDKLRWRLNDPDPTGTGVGGDYTDTELIDCINASYKRHQILLKSNIIRINLSFVAHEHTYDTYPIFEPLEIKLTGAKDPLSRKNFADWSVHLLQWDNEAEGEPLAWMPIKGSYIRLHKTPAQPYSAVAYGYGVAEMSSGSDQPVGLPAGFDDVALMDDAEMEARKRRPTHSNNMTVVAGLLGWVQTWIEKARKALKGEA
ncbi:MAG: hypothetical protein ACYC27_14645 [Armatimonadota bacterium]